MKHQDNDLFVKFHSFHVVDHKYFTFMISLHLSQIVQQLLVQNMELVIRVQILVLFVAFIFTLISEKDINLSLPPKLWFKQQSRLTFLALGGSHFKRRKINLKLWKKQQKNNTTIIWHGNLPIKKPSVESHNCICSDGIQQKNKKANISLKELNIYIIRHSVKNNYGEISASNQYHQSNMRNNANQNNNPNHISCQEIKY